MQKRPPGPQKAPGGESFDSLSPWTPTLNDQGRGPAGPLPLDLSPGCPTGSKVTLRAYSVTPEGFGRTPDPSGRKGTGSSQSGQNSYGGVSKEGTQRRNLHGLAALPTATPNNALQVTPSSQNRVRAFGSPVLCPLLALFRSPFWSQKGETNVHY